MYDYTQRVKEYLENNFVPGTRQNFNLKLNTQQLLQFLFDVFPADCITDYELNDILQELGYKPYNLLERKEKSKQEVKVYWLLQGMPSL